MGLTLDESALLLELDDVYWRREGLLSVQITLAVIALLSALTLALRLLRRGEQVVLDPTARLRLESPRPLLSFAPWRLEHSRRRSRGGSRRRRPGGAAAVAPRPEAPVPYGGPVPPGGGSSRRRRQVGGWEGRPLASWWSRVGAALFDG